MENNKIKPEFELQRKKFQAVIIASAYPRTPPPSLISTAEEPQDHNSEVFDLTNIDFNRTKKKPKRNKKVKASFNMDEQEFIDDDKHDGIAPETNEDKIYVDPVASNETIIYTDKPPFALSNAASCSTQRSDPD